MPSSGYGIEDIIGRDSAPRRNEPGFDPKEWQKRVKYLLDCKAQAEKFGLFTEWLGSFVAAWKQGANVYEAAEAGLIEWDL